MATKRKITPLSAALLETAADMRKGGLLTEAAEGKITLRLVGDRSPPLATPVSGEEIRALRLRARMSQAVFARALNMTTGYVSQLERGAKQASGATLALLNLIRRTGVDALQ